MILLAGFLEVLFQALGLIGLAAAVGGLVWVLVALRPFGKLTFLAAKAARRSLLLATGGAIDLALAQLLMLVIDPWALADELGRWPLAEFLSTGFARAGLIHAGLALLLAATLFRLAGRTSDKTAWAIALLSAAALLVSGAWLVHAVSRLEWAGPLMVLTVVHQCAAAVWIGGTLHLTVAWHMVKESGNDAHIWPLLLARFSPVAMISVGWLLAAGLFLSWRYVGDGGALVGTAYGIMVLTKIALLAVALGLGALNFLHIRRWRLYGETEGLQTRVPCFVETEMAIGMVIFLVAASLTSQPPAIDVAAEQATPAEVLQVFAPKRPQLVPPPHGEMLARARSVVDPFALPSDLDRIQSNFNHNLSGLFVILAGFGAMVHRTRLVPAARYWPLFFILLAGFIALFAEPTVWPLGPEGFRETLLAPEVLQHRLATLLMAALAVGEWRVQAGGLAATRWRFAFPVLAFSGGALLMTHAHAVFASKWVFLIEASHAAIGFLALLLGASRWLELRLPAPTNRVFGRLWPVFLTLIGFVLLFYRE